MKIEKIKYHISLILPITSKAVAPSALSPFAFLAVHEYVPLSLSLDTVCMTSVPFENTLTLGPLIRG